MKVGALHRGGLVCGYTVFPEKIRFPHFSQIEANTMEQNTTITHRSQRGTKLITDSEIDQILAAAIGLAERTAHECTRHSECAPPPFDSFEEWYAFDAALESWMASRTVHRIHSAA